MSAVENLEEQVRSLTELVKQLEADNQRLRETSSLEGGPGFFQHSPPQPAEVVLGQLPTERLVCVLREQKCPRFLGKMAVDNMLVEDWIGEARRSLVARAISSLEQALFLYELLDGKAKREIKFSPAADRNDPQRKSNRPSQK